MTHNKNMMLVHGWGANAAKLEPLADALRLLGWQAYIVRLPGFDLPPPEQAWGVHEYVRYVLEQGAQQFDQQRFFYFGHSFGGRLGIVIGATQPQQISGLVLCAAAGISQGNPIKRAVFWVLAKVGKLLPHSLQGAFRKLLYRAAREHDYEKAQGVMREVMRKVVAEDLKPFVAQMRAPLLLLWGRLDKATPLRDARFIQRKQPAAELIVFDDEGHRLPYNRPAELAARIDSWSHGLK
jgi:pimeloyl-ACP methyl ester carboxylesterase